MQSTVIENHTNTVDSATIRVAVIRAFVWMPEAVESASDISAAFPDLLANNLNGTTPLAPLDQAIIRQFDLSPFDAYYKQTFMDLIIHISTQFYTVADQDSIILLRQFINIIYETAEERKAPLLPGEST